MGKLSVLAASAAVAIAVSLVPAKADPYMGPTRDGLCWQQQAFNTFTVWGMYGPCPTKASAAVAPKRHHKPRA